MLAERLHVSHLEPGLFHGGDGVRDIDQLPIGEDIAVDERGAALAGAPHRADGVVHQSTLRLHHSAEDLEVALQPRVADVLGHPDRGDGVEPLAAEVAIVLQADLDAIGQA